MKHTLTAGMTHRFIFKIPPTKTVPHIYPESEEFRRMPEVLATGFMVGLLEWACVDMLMPHLDAGEGSLGVHVNVSHQAATPPGMTVTVDVECLEVKGPRLKFRVRAHDGLDMIGEGTHERFVIKWDRFNQRLKEKAARVAA